MKNPLSPFRPRQHLLTGIAAGLVAGAVTGATGRILSRLVSKEQKERDRMVRQGSAHQVAGPRLVKRITGKALSARGNRRAQMAFNVAYGIGWGLLFAITRKRFPTLFRPAALPFGILFFAACDGIIAPLLKMSPPLPKIPWQPNVKELGNHLAWAASAEMVHRVLAARQGKTENPRTD